jgi:hypothetical protein
LPFLLFPSAAVLPLLLLLLFSMLLLFPRLTWLALLLLFLPSLLLLLPSPLQLSPHTPKP